MEPEVQQSVQRLHFSVKRLVRSWGAVGELICSMSEKKDVRLLKM